MEFLQLKYFLFAAQTENFSHTAAHFCVPPSTVSASVKNLEQELGVRLFDRKANRIFLNERGKIFQDCAAAIFQNLEKTCQRLSESKDNPSGKVVMLIQTERRLLNGIISDFKSLFPQISFVLDFKEIREARTYDLIVTDRKLNRSDFEELPFLREEICLALPSNHPLSSQKSVRMEELSHERFVCQPVGTSLRDLTERLCKEALFTPEIAIECDDTYYLREYLRMGMGVGLVPTVSWKGQIANEVCLLSIGDGVFRESKVYRNLASSSAAVTFFDYLKERIPVPD